jgi:Holliday junction resolvase-like predicted endonuclease
MDREGFVKILGPRVDPAFVYQDVTTARTTAYSISGTNAKFFRYPVKMSDPLKIGLRYLVIQIFHRASDTICLSLNIKTMNHETVKFTFSTIERKKQSRAMRMQAKIQIERIESDIWVNLCFDMVSIVRKYWAGGAFECLQSIEIAPTCLIRWIFATATQLNPDQAGEDLPRSIQFVGGIPSSTVLISESSAVSSVPHAKVRLPARPPVSGGKSIDNQPLSSENPFEVRGYGTRRPSDVGRTDKETAFSASVSGNPGNEEEELELVMIDALNCYYCPSNQRYYQIDE